MENKDRYIIRNCKHHGDAKFILENRGYYRCTKCRMDGVNRKRKSLKKDLVAYKGGECEKCGYNKCVAAMDFHHKDSDDKDFALSNGNTKSWAKLRQEADKCLLLCCRCHRELHEELNGYKELRTNIEQKGYKNIKIESCPSRKKYEKKHNICIICNKKTYNKKCCSYACAGKNKRKVKDRPSKRRLIQLLINNNWTQIATMFCVSDNAVRKWANQYGINTDRKNIRTRT